MIDPRLLHAPSKPSSPTRHATSPPSRLAAPRDGLVTQMSHEQVCDIVNALCTNSGLPALISAIASDWEVRQGAPAHLHAQPVLACRLPWLCA